MLVKRLKVRKRNKIPHEELSKNRKGTFPRAILSPSSLNPKCVNFHIKKAPILISKQCMSKNQTIISFSFGKVPFPLIVRRGNLLGFLEHKN